VFPDPSHWVNARRSTYADQAYSQEALIVSDHLKLLFGDVPRDGSDEFLSSEDLEIFLVLPMSQAGPIEDVADIFDMGSCSEKVFP
jgi:hypothetical protein